MLAVYAACSVSVLDRAGAQPSPGAPDLDTIAVRSPALDAVLSEIDATEAALEAAVAAEADAADVLVQLDEAAATLRQREAEAIVAAADASGRIDGAEVDLDDLGLAIRLATDDVEAVAVAGYVAGDDLAERLRPDPEDASEPARVDKYSNAAIDVTLDRLDELERARTGAYDRLDRAEADLAAARAELALVRRLLVELGERRVATVAERDRAAARQNELSAALTDLAERLRATRLEAEVVGSDLALVVLDALWSAAARNAERHPGCNLDWTVLAGISYVETKHGNHGGASVDAQGNVTPRVYGRVLDGSDGVAEVLDSDGGAVDGDGTHDRAVGPMQFIPTTWSIVGRDGSGDGIADPHNYYDAALAAADLLCRTGLDTSTNDGLRAAIRRYNQSDVYVDEVIAHRSRYEALRW
ncbi:MAG: hypothetical protein S0880_33345 [Actinomycetota bacterium]|nr:hypothetical protein [Actinomycetota bacterium]